MQATLRHWDLCVYDSREGRVWRRMFCLLVMNCNCSTKLQCTAARRKSWRHSLMWGMTVIPRDGSLIYNLSFGNRFPLTDTQKKKKIHSLLQSEKNSLALVVRSLCERNFLEAVLLCVLTLDNEQCCRTDTQALNYCLTRIPTLSSKYLQCISIFYWVFWA